MQMVWPDIVPPKLHEQISDRPLWKIAVNFEVITRTEYEHLRRLESGMLPVRQHGTQTSRPCQIEDGPCSQDPGDPCTACHKNHSCTMRDTNQRRFGYVGGRKHDKITRNIGTYSSVSQVSMVAPATGLPLVSSTRPSTHIFCPFPSDAIDPPSGTIRRNV